MILPTIDWTAIVKKAVLTAKKAVFNPIPVVIAFAGVVGGVCTSIWSKLDLFSIPEVSFSWSQSGDVASLLFYIIAGDHLALIVNTFINMINVIVPFAVTSITALCVGAWVYGANRTMAKHIKDMMG